MYSLLWVLRLRRRRSYRCMAKLFILWGCGCGCVGGFRIGCWVRMRVSVLFSAMRGSSKKTKKAGVIFLLCVVFLILFILLIVFLLILFILLIVSLFILLVFFIFSGRVRWVLLRRTNTRWSMAKHVADPKGGLCNLLSPSRNNFLAKQLGVMEFESKFNQHLQRRFVKCETFGTYFSKSACGKREEVAVVRTRREDTSRDEMEGQGEPEVPPASVDATAKQAEPQPVEGTKQAGKRAHEETTTPEETKQEDSTTHKRQKAEEGHASTHHHDAHHQQQHQEGNTKNDSFIKQTGLILVISPLFATLTSPLALPSPLLCFDD